MEKAFAFAFFVKLIFDIDDKNFHDYQLIDVIYYINLACVQCRGDI